MAAKGLFTTGFTIDGVIAIQSKAKEMLLEGKTLMSWNDGGTSVSKQFVMPVSEVLEECAYALKVLDPETYGRPQRMVDTSYVPNHFPL